MSPLHPRVKLTANEQEWLAERPLTIRCALCGWTMSGTTAETKAGFRAHRVCEHGAAPDPHEDD